MTSDTEQDLLKARLLELEHQLWRRDIILGPDSQALSEASLLKWKVQGSLHDYHWEAVLRGPLCITIRKLPRERAFSPGYRRQTLFHWVVLNGDIVIRSGTSDSIGGAASCAEGFAEGEQRRMKSDGTLEAAPIVWDICGSFRDPWYEARIGPYLLDVCRLSTQEGGCWDWTLFDTTSELPSSWGPLMPTVAHGEAATLESAQQTAIERAQALLKGSER